MMNEYYEVFKQKELCTQDDAPKCTWACPVGFDVRSFLSKVKEGCFEAAYRSYQKKVIFPGIISRICDELCKKECLRGSIDDPVEIRKIEQACTYFAKVKEPEIYAIRKKNKKIAVIGGGLFGCACALTLYEKGYDVWLYEKENRLGGQIWNFPDDILPESVASEELNRVFREKDIHVITGFEGKAPLPEEYDAVIIAADISKDRKAFQVKETLCADHWFDPADPYSAIKSIEKGVECAIAAEHHFQGNLYPGKEKAEPNLSVSLKDIDKKAKVEAVSGSPIYTKEEAAEEASRCLDCQCKQCVKSCEFMQYYKRYPKHFINDAQQSLRTLKLLQAKLAARQTNSCNLCGLCKEICPTDVDMSEVYLYSRRIMLNNENLPAAFHHFWLEDMDFANSKDAFLSKIPPGFESCKYLFFPGCQMGGSDPSYVYNTYEYLREFLDSSTGIDLGCCCAPSEWSGYHHKTLEVVGQFKEHWERMGFPKVILSCPSCEKMFQKYHSEVPTISLWDIFLDCGLPEKSASGSGQPVALFDPCSSRYDPESQTAVRGILNKMGFQIEELSYNKKFAQCCGYGGLTYGANPSLTKEIIDKRIHQNPLDFVTYCTNCRDTFVRAGKNTWHILDLLFHHHERSERKSQPVTLSEKRENRVKLKSDLEKNIWGGDSGRGCDYGIECEAWQNLNMQVDAELRRKLDDDLILVDDMKMAIWHSETSGKRLLLPNGHFIGHLARNIITYWAEYSKTEKGYHLHNGYSHRLKIEE